MINCQIVAKKIYLEYIFIIFYEEEKRELKVQITIRIIRGHFKFNLVFVIKKNRVPHFYEFRGNNDHRK